MIRDAFTTIAKRKVDDLLALAMHSSATTFYFFKEQVWIKFFEKICWTVSRKVKIAGVMMDNTFKSTMARNFAVIRNEVGATLGNDSTANIFSKSICNVIKHTTLHFFIEYLRFDLACETTPNIVSNITDLLAGMELELGFNCH